MNSSPTGSLSWWREKELLWVLLLGAFVHGPQLSALSIRGEEPRWARVAIEMRERNDWIVPRQQGAAFLSRPPLQNWLIAGSFWVLGREDVFAVRLPSLLATLLTACLVYGYGRAFLARLGALAAALAFLTMIQVLELGSRAESEAIYTLLLAASLLAWHGGQLRGRSMATCWIVGYSLAGLGTLTKGPQAIVYFGVVTWAYLLVRRDWQALFHPGHALGIMAFVAIVGLWLFPFVQSEGWNAAVLLVTGDVAMRFQERAPSATIKHLLAFPWEYLGCMLPWSLLLLGFCKQSVRAACRNDRAPLLFLALAVLLTLPSVWLVTGARARYLMPLYPCMALIVGWVLQQFLGEKAMVANARHMERRLMGVAAGLGLAYWALTAFYFAPRSHDAGQVVAAMRERHSIKGEMVSFGPVWHQFAYFYREPIRPMSWPKEDDDVGAIEYFCFDRWDQQPTQLPFAWEEVACVPGDRYLKDRPSYEIIVGRRIAQVAGR